MAETPAPERERAPRPRAGGGRRTLVLIAAVAIAPVVASYTVYYLFPRESRVNYGTLLPTAPVPAIEGTRPDGKPFRFDDLRGRWVLVVAAAGECDAACERTLYATRQARTMQGREQERVARVWLVAGGNAPPAALLAEHPGLLVVRVPESAPAMLPGGPGALYIVDPLGNLVLRYGENPDIKGIAKDLTRLLKASRIG
jgi:hypothetical protein